MKGHMQEISLRPSKAKAARSNRAGQTKKISKKKWLADRSSKLIKPKSTIKFTF
jgi:hypothetical protein